jgi:hypothetical protein
VVGRLRMKAVHIVQRIEMGRLCKREKRITKEMLWRLRYTFRTQAWDSAIASCFP